jgi:prophage regulatory protein
MQNKMTNDRLVRLVDIIGATAFNIPPIIPVSRSTWLSGVKSGMYPQPFKIGRSAVAWKLSEVMELVDNGVSLA